MNTNAKKFSGVTSPQIRPRQLAVDCAVQIWNCSVDRGVVPVVEVSEMAKIIESSLGQLEAPASKART
jgi:hypothetical protein